MSTIPKNPPESNFLPSDAGQPLSYGGKKAPVTSLSNKLAETQSKESAGSPSLKGKHIIKRSSNKYEKALKILGLSGDASVSGITQKSAKQDKLDALFIDTYHLYAINDPVKAYYDASEETIVLKKKSEAEEGNEIVPDDDSGESPVRFQAAEEFLRSKIPSELERLKRANIASDLVEAGMVSKAREDIYLTHSDFREYLFALINLKLDSKTPELLFAHYRLFEELLVLNNEFEAAKAVTPEQAKQNAQLNEEKLKAVKEIIMEGLEAIIKRQKPSSIAEESIVAETPKLSPQEELELMGDYLEELDKGRDIQAAEILQARTKELVQLAKSIPDVVIKKDDVTDMKKILDKFVSEIRQMVSPQRLQGQQKEFFALIANINEKLEELSKTLPHFQRRG